MRNARCGMRNGLVLGEVCEGEEVGGGEAGGAEVFGVGAFDEGIDGVGGVGLGFELELLLDEIGAQGAVGLVLLGGEEVFGFFFGEVEVI